MTGFGNYLLLCFGTLFAVLNPLATVPPFLAMTETDTPDDRLHMARRACSVAFVVLVVFSVSGLAILDFFGISVPAFKIAGGLVLLRASMEMLKGSRAKITAEEREEGVHKDDVSITPLAVPILCGPVTIASGVLLSARASTWMHYLVLIGTILVIYLLTYGVLRLAVMYSHLSGELTLRIVSRLMGLLLAALAVQFVINGIRETDFSLPPATAGDAVSAETTSRRSGFDTLTEKTRS
jgi:multiple antibiotic resistance protein